jgi:hypothetical protein
MSDASVFRVFAEEAVRDSSRATGEVERRAFEDLACTWAEAASMSDRIFGSGIVSPPSVGQDNGGFPWK